MKYLYKILKLNLEPKKQTRKNNLNNKSKIMIAKQ